MTIDTTHHQQPVQLPVQRPTEIGQATAVEQARAIAEVQAAVVVAQQVPRDVRRAEGEMRDTCGRLGMADRAFYQVKNRGSGPTVHLMRELARIWGNVQYGVHELRRDDDAGISEIQAFAWDVQTNTRSTRTFVVPHQRMKDGRRQKLVDLGDVYLNNQNIGARAVRECIATVLPAWFTDAAQDLCKETLRGGGGVPLLERVEKAVSAYAGRGVKVPQLEERLGKRRGQWDAADVADLSVLWQSIDRGETRVEDEFPPSAVTGEQLAEQGTGASRPARVEARTPAPAPGPASGEGEAPGPGVEESPSGEESTPADDRGIDPAAPSPDAAPTTRKGAKSSPQQRASIQALLAKLDVTADARGDILGALSGRNAPTAPGDLTLVEAGNILDQLHHCKTAEDLDALVAAELGRGSNDGE